MMILGLIIAIPIAILLLLLLLRKIFILCGVNYKPFIKLCCELGWHWTIDKDTSKSDQANQYGRCNGCKNPGMFDSNNDFFTNY